MSVPPNMSVTLTLPPIDQAFLALVIIGATVQVARALTRRLDQDIEASPGVQALPPTVRSTVTRLLAGVHHWWIGGLVAYYANQAGNFAAMCIGLGLMIDDYEDLPARLRAPFRALREGWSGKGTKP